MATRKKTDRAAVQFLRSGCQLFRTIVQLLRAVLQVVDLPVQLTGVRLFHMNRQGDGIQGNTLHREIRHIRLDGERKILPRQLHIAQLPVSAHICLCRAFGLDIAALHGVQQHCGLDHVGLIEIAVRQFVFRDGSADYQMSVGPGKLIGCDVFSIQHIGNRDIPRKLRILQVPLIIERTSLRGHCDRVPIQ